MKLGVVRRILSEDLKGGEKPGWLDGLIAVLNDFIEKVGQALQNKLTFADNFSCRVHTQKFTSGTEYPIANQSNLRVSGVICLDTTGAQLSKPLQWQRGNDQTTNVTLTFESATESQCSILILLG